jgi:hypothetical protein
MLASFPRIGDLVATVVPPRIAERKEKKVCGVNVGPVNRTGVLVVTGVLSLVTDLKSTSRSVFTDVKAVTTGTVSRQE